MAYPVTDIANYFIWRVNDDLASGDNITHLKVQKLVYYAQGFHLAWYGEPLFAEPILAWEHGPVVRKLYDAYREFGSSPLRTPDEFSPERLDSHVVELLEEVFRVYGQFSAWGLRNLTHDEAPWKDTPRNEEIAHGLMRDYFSSELTIAQG